MTGRRKFLFRAMSAAVCAALLGGGAIAAGTGGPETVDGITAYMGIFPAAMIRGHDIQHAEREMHGGVPGGEHAFHVMVALFDAETGRRIEDATVEAEVAPLALAPERKRLDRMDIADAVTYGNYFTMRIREPYEITFSIRTPRRREPAEIEFTYEHRR